MHRLGLIASVLIAFLLGHALLGHAPSAHAADPAARDIAARIEIHPLATLTLSDAQFLAGDKAGAQPVITAVLLRLPRGNGPFPLVIMVHGSGGPTGGNDLWMREMTEWGVATLLIDGFAGRGLVSTSADQARLGRLNLIIDAYRALELAAKHPRIDKSRIALMGFSRGGQATLYAGVRRFHALWNTSGAAFAAYLPFYPDCKTSYQADTEMAAVPIRIFHGEADDYNPAEPCRQFVARLKAAGADAAITTYPDAHHSFDNPLGSTTPALSPDSQTVRACSIKEEPQGRLVNAATGELFTYKDACVQRGPHTGYHPTAAAASVKAVKQILTAALKLE